MNNPKYSAFQIDDEYFAGNQLKRGWVVRGQRNDTLNWERLTEELSSREEAVETMRNIFAAQGYTNAIMYDEHGYGIDD